MMTWFDYAVSALSETGQKSKLKLRRGRPSDKSRSAFVQWVLRECVPASPACQKMADLWERGETDPEAWEAARAEAIAEREAATAGDPSYVAWQVNRRIAHDRRPDLEPDKTSSIVSRDEDEAAVAVLETTIDLARSAAEREMAAECAFSASFPDRPECIRGVIQCAALRWEHGPVRDAAYRVMTEKLVALTKA